MVICWLKKMCMCICGYYKYHNELCYKAPVNGMFAFVLVDGNCKYCNELCYKAPWVVFFVFIGLVGYRCH